MDRGTVQVRNFTEHRNSRPAGIGLCRIILRRIRLCRILLAGRILRGNRIVGLEQAPHLVPFPIVGPALHHALAIGRCTQVMPAVLHLHAHHGAFVSGLLFHRDFLVSAAIPLVQAHRDARILRFIRSIEREVAKIDAVSRTRKRRDCRNRVIALAVAQRKLVVRRLDHASAKVHREDAHRIGLRGLGLPYAHPIRLEIRGLVRSDFNVIARPAANGQVHDDVLRRKLLDFGRAIETGELLVVKVKTECRLIPFHGVVMEAGGTVRVVVLVATERSLVIPRRAMAAVPARVGVMQVVVVLLARRRNLEDVDFRRPTILQCPEGRPRSLLPRGLETAFDVAVLHFEMILGIDCTRGVVDGNFLVVELRLGPVPSSFRMLLLFALQLERTVGDYHVLFGAVGAVIMRGAPVVRRVPLSLIQTCPVEVVLKHEFPTAKIRRRICKRSSYGQKRKRCNIQKFHIHTQSKSKR